MVKEHVFKNGDGMTKETSTPKEIEVSTLRRLYKGEGIEKILEEEFPELFEAVPKDGWYIDKRYPGWMACAEEGIVSHCITCGGMWFDNIFEKLEGEFEELATSEEVESKLWEEASKRGLTKETKLDQMPKGGTSTNPGSMVPSYSKSGDVLYGLHGAIYHKGDWATPLEYKEVKKLEVGKWYDFMGSIMRICEPDDGKVKCYGFFGEGGSWYDNRDDDRYFGHIEEVESWKEVSEEEVQKMFSEEAFKRGYISVGTTEPFHFIFGTEFLFNSGEAEGGEIICSRGKWAEVLEEPMEFLIRDLQEVLENYKKTK